jgi:ParB family chromosome partitioning protein
VDVDRKQAYLMGLVENLARVPPGTIWFAREVLRMKQEGFSRQEIARIVSRSESYVDAYIRLAEDGEERLLRGVERGVFNMSFARRVVEAGSGEIQNVLMDAYDSGMVNSANFMQVKRILATRLERKARPKSGSESGRGGNKHVKYTVQQLKHDIVRVTREKESYVREAEHKENRLFALSGALEVLMKEPEFVALLAGEGLDARPQLAGKYGALAGGERGMQGGPGDD